MQPELYLSYSSAFVIGLLGSTHCLGMCGGISASLSMALPVGKGFRLRQSLLLMAFNFGRIGSYALIATLVALLSTQAASQWRWARCFFGLGPLPSMLATGYAANWIRGIKSNQGFRKISGVLLILFGLWTLPFQALLMH